MITYMDSAADIRADQLTDFFDGWPNPPSPQTHLRIFEGSDEIVLAFDDETQQVVGFITAITDGLLSAFIPLLEVLPEYKGRGIGRELVRRMLKRLNDYYMVDLVCDPELTPFYERFGMRGGTAMMLRKRIG